MPILETLYSASKRTSNHIYILLIILLILSQDSSFNASIHKIVRITFICRLSILFPRCVLFFLCYYFLVLFPQVLPSIPWYQEHLLHRTSLGSLMVIILIRTVKYNLSKLRVCFKVLSLLIHVQIVAVSLLKLLYPPAMAHVLEVVKSSWFLILQQTEVLIYFITTEDLLGSATIVHVLLLILVYSYLLSLLVTVIYVLKTSSTLPSRNILNL